MSANFLNRVKIIFEFMKSSIIIRQLYVQGASDADDLSWMNKVKMSFGISIQEQNWMLHWILNASIIRNPESNLMNYILNSTKNTNGIGVWEHIPFFSKLLCACTYKMYHLCKL